MGHPQRSRNQTPPFRPRPVNELKAIIQVQNIQILPGDILFIRVGFTAPYNALTPSDQEKYPNRQLPGLLGLEATRKSLKGLWKSRFSCFLTSVHIRVPGGVAIPLKAVAISQAEQSDGPVVSNPTFQCYEV